MMKQAGLISLFLAVFAFYLFGVAPTVTTGDSGEFVTAAATLSIPHAPSYPTYTILGKCFLSVVPFGNPAYRMNAFSALCSTVALFFLFSFLRHLTLGGATSLLLCVIVGTFTSFWHNSLITEVFALNTLFVVALLWILTFETSASIILFAFILGLGLGNHQILIFMLPVALWWKRHVLFNPKLMLVLIFFFTLGFSIYLVLPLRAQNDPPLNWGQPKTISKLVGTITRRDYGSFQLATGATPERNGSNTSHQMGRFIKQLNLETPGWILLLSLVGWILVLLRGADKVKQTSLVLLFLLSGPFFYVLSNLPFTAQSQGIMGRFIVIPVLIFLLGLAGWKKVFPRLSVLLLSSVVFVHLFHGVPQAHAMRTNLMVWDYGRSMLQTLPSGAALYMDGGDDAFYSLAYLSHVLKKRPDVELHDRGGLVFKNPYGDDFRKLPLEEKKARRFQIESAVASHRSLFYSSMDVQALPGTRLEQNGFLLSAEPRKIPWDLFRHRSLTSPLGKDYRHRALAAFFPFMAGQLKFTSGQWKEAIQYYRRAVSIGFDVDWLLTNLSTLYSQQAYEYLQINNLAGAEALYTEWLKFDPSTDQPFVNLGVVYERQSRFAEAQRMYEQAAQRFPARSDAVYNLSVLAWKEGRWLDVVRHLEEVLRRNPSHPTAQHLLIQAKGKLMK